MNPLWKPPALRWKPLSAPLIGAVAYGALGLTFHAYPKFAEFLPLLFFSSAFLPFPANALASFQTPAATEWLLGAGLTRRALALRFALDLFLWSLIHAAGVTALLAWAPPRLTIPTLEEVRDHPVSAGLIPLFLLFLAARSLVGMMTHSETSTAVPAWIRWAVGRPSLPRAKRVAGAVTAVLLFFTLAAVPIVVWVWTRSPVWLAVPAALYLRFAHAMAVTSECVLRPDSFSLTQPEPPATARAAAPWERADREAPSTARTPLRGLCWDGANRWARRTLWLYPAFAVLLLALAAFFPPTDEPRWFWYTATLLGGVPLLILLLVHPRIFAWNASEEAVEYVFVRGIPLRTLNRIRLTTAGGLVAASLAYVLALVPLGSYRSLALGLLLYVGATVLLEGNADLLRRPFLRCVRVAQVGGLLRGGFWVIYLAGMVLGLRHTAEAPYWLPLGLLVFVPAAYVWVRSFAGACFGK